MASSLGPSVLILRCKNIDEIYLLKNTEWIITHQLVPCSTYSKVISPVSHSSHANYSQEEIDDVQKQLDLSNKIGFEITTERQKEEKKITTHSNKRNFHGQYLSYTEMQQVDPPVTAFNTPTTT